MGCGRSSMPTVKEPFEPSLLASFSAVLSEHEPPRGISTRTTNGNLRRADRQGIGGNLL